MTDIDLDRVLREIDDEVRARRASGDFPPGMERDLDLVFARYAPATLAGDDLTALIEAADRTSFIDPNPPTESRMPGVSLLKRVERKLLGWFFRFITQQVTAFGGTAVHAMRQMAKRIEALEARMATVDAGGAIAAPVVDEPVLAALGAVTGRVLVPNAPDAARLADAYAPGDDVAEHLRDVEDGALGAAVLAGIVDRAPLGTQVALVERAGRALREGGRIAVVATDPSAWGAANPVEADLAPGRPLHAETWAHLLERGGFSDVRVARDGQRNIITATR